MPRNSVIQFWATVLCFIVMAEYLFWVERQSSGGPNFAFAGVMIGMIGGILLFRFYELMIDED